MSYHSKSINEIVNEIEFEKAFLPAIQRKFVWPRVKIEKLFDSIMRNYPIGSFLFWELKKEKAENYVFYNFLKDYDSRNPYNKRKDSSFRHEEIVGVLDGQQRLSSLYLGFQGSHRERKKYKKGLSDESFPQTFLYLNLLSLPYTTDDEDDIVEIRDEQFEFSFLTKEEAKQYNRKSSNGNTEYVYWYKVGDVLRLKTEPDYENNIDKLAKTLENAEQKEAIIQNKRIAKTAIQRLHKRTLDPLINYFKVSNADLDDILEIFIRVNSGGTILSKTDLLFSTIVATWEDGRDEIEAFLRHINQIGDGFWFNNDFLMRCCLVLSDLQVLFKVDSFKSENVTLIKSNWSKMKSAIEKAVETIAAFGFNGQLLTSQNAVVVIAYFFMKDGKPSDDSLTGIKKYLLYSLLKNIYGGQGDQVIRSFREHLRMKNEDGKFILKHTHFDFEGMLDLKLPANKSLRISSEDIEDFMNHRKGPNSFFVLSLLYPNLKYTEVKFHQDHIHPASGFDDAKMKSAEIPAELWHDWRQIKDCVANLQIMEGTQNSSKNATPFIEWIHGSRDEKSNIPDVDKFCVDNFIPTGEDWHFSNFMSFYDKRKALIRAELERILNISE